ncbi:hypothetical protein EGT74_22525 [Chitinophaga lutea]|uniref:Peptidase M56 domain-containing protein n=1 Tax=Chitinophaga lutea TaxID=2488634 RepID=A0A3N4Q1B6_9BACT|nr:M56 family metallopeptidase [Chitinophaga lutea]RPE09750.1 hypothetical protein EGT74_22525 [Chitinophaga lutea]
MLNNEVLSAICRTFLHSIWQGVVAAAIAGAVLALTRRSSALRRYNLLGAILLISLAAIGITFYLELQTAVAAAPVSETVAIAAAPAPLVTQSYWDVLMNYLNTHAPFIMLVWSIVFLFKCFRIGFGFYHIYYIRHHKTSEPDQNWSDRLQLLATQLGIRKAVKLVESALVQVPLTTGFIRPCIFVPLGLLAQLPADQVEAVLLHELAHIRRRDYLVNIVQSFAESIFFFNPALLWISARLREEREACCDDVAVAHTPHKASYLHALVSFASQSPSGQLEMALSKKKNFLLNRVKRVLTRENQQLTLMEKSILLIGVIVISAFTMIPAPVEQQEPAAQTAEDFIIYMPAATAAQTGQPVLRDTTIPRQTQPGNYSSRYDTSIQYNVNVNLDTSIQNIAYNFAKTNILNPYKFDFEYNAATNLKTAINVNNDVRILTLDSSNMQFLKKLDIDSSRMEYLKKTPLQTKEFNFTQQYTFAFDSSFRYQADADTTPRIEQYKKVYFNAIQRSKDSAQRNTRQQEWKQKKAEWESRAKNPANVKDDSLRRQKKAVKPEAFLNTLKLKQQDSLLWKQRSTQWQVKMKHWRPTRKDSLLWKQKTAEWQSKRLDWKPGQKDSMQWKQKNTQWEAKMKNWRPTRKDSLQWKSKMQAWPQDSAMKRKGFRKPAEESQPGAAPQPGSAKSAATPQPKTLPFNNQLAKQEPLALKERKPKQAKPAPAPKPQRPKKTPRKPDILEENTPTSIYNSFILPKRIDC